MDTSLPIHPQPSFYETTTVEGQDGEKFGHEGVQAIASRPSWDPNKPWPTEDAKKVKPRKKAVPRKKASRPSS